MTTNENQNKKFQEINSLDKIIHEPARFMIMSYLYVVDCADFIFLEKQTGLTRGNMSSHLSKLEKAGYVKIKKKFMDKIPRTVLSLTAQGRKAFVDYRNQLKNVLNEFN